MASAGNGAKRASSLNSQSSHANLDVFKPIPSRDDYSAFCSKLADHMVRFLRFSFSIEIEAIISEQNQGSCADLSMVFKVLDGLFGIDSRQLPLQTQYLNGEHATLFTPQHREALKQQYKSAVQNARLRDVAHAYIFNHLLSCHETNEPLSKRVINRMCRIFTNPSHLEYDKMREMLEMGITSIVSATEWRNAIFYQAVNLFAENPHPLALSIQLVDTEAQKSRRGQTGHSRTLATATTASLASIDHTLIKQLIPENNRPLKSLVEFSIGVLQRWVKICSKMEAKFIASSSSSNTSNDNDPNLIDRRAESDPLGHIFVIFDNDQHLKKSLGMSIEEELQFYARRYVDIIPGIKDDVDQIINNNLARLKEMVEKSNNVCDDSVKEILKFGLPSRNILNLIREKGYFYGLEKQKAMYEDYLTRRMDIYSKATLEKHLRYMRKQSDGFLSQLQSALTQSKKTDEQTLTSYASQLVSLVKSRLKNEILSDDEDGSDESDVGETESYHSDDENESVIDVGESEIETQEVTQFSTRQPSKKLRFQEEQQQGVRSTITTTKSSIARRTQTPGKKKLSNPTAVASSSSSTSTRSISRPPPQPAQPPLQKLQPPSLAKKMSGGSDSGAAPKKQIPMLTKYNRKEPPRESYEHAESDESDRLSDSGANDARSNFSWNSETDYQDDNLALHGISDDESSWSIM
jgi:hypothetical protein